MAAILSRFRWINSLWPSDTIWRHRAGSTLIQVIACCLTASSNYLHQCWLIISKVYWHLCESDFTRDALAINHMNKCENYQSKISSKSPSGQWANAKLLPCHDVIHAVNHASSAVHRWFINCYSNVMEISFCSHLNSNELITTIFCRWHGSCSVMGYAKIHGDLIARVKSQ